MTCPGPGRAEVGRPDKIRQSIPVLRRLVTRFAPEIGEERLLITGSFLAVFLEVFLRLLEPWPLAIVLDHVLGLGGGAEPPLLGPLANQSPTRLLLLAAFALVAVAGLRAVASYSATVGFALVGNRLLTRVRNALYRRLQGLSVGFHSRAEKGDLVLRVIGDVGMVREVVVTAMLPLLGNLFILAGMIVVMLWMQWQLTLVALTTVPLFWLSTARLGARIRTVARKQRRREGGLATRVSETMGAIETVQALSLEETFAADFVDQGERSMAQGVQGKRLSARLERTVDVLNALATALVLWFGASIVLRGGLSPGELVVFLTYLKSAVRPVRNFAKYSARLAKASAAAERVLEVLDEQPDVREAPDAREAPIFRGAIRFERATFGYGDEPVLRAVDFSVAAGERVAVVGASGAGKSTLVGAISRLRDPSEGRILIDEIDLRELTLASVRRQVSVVLQESLLFAATIRENIAMGANEVSDEAVRAAASSANASEFIELLPEGYETRIGERGMDLSIGQRQRIAIARASVVPTSVVVLDEPLTGLDGENARVVEEALDRLCAGRTTLLITHDLRHAATCDRIVVLEGGTVTEIGTHAELIRAGRGYEHMCRAGASAPGPRQVETHVVAR